ncbi:MAG: carbohydrate kinase family protein [Terriglobales bacterium]
MWDVLGLGNSCLDHLFTLPRYPQPGESVAVLRRESLPGGQVATAMLGCARLGLRAGMVLRTGDDDAGERQWAALRAAGVDLSLARTVPGVPSALAYIILDATTGERGVIWNTDDRLAVRPGEVSRNDVARTRAVFLDGKDEEAGLQVAAWAQAAGIPVVSDVDCERASTRALLAHITHFISNEEFVRELAGTEDLHEALRRLAALGPAVVCATCGAAGAVAFDGREFLDSPAFTLIPVDTTGAGDAFHAGYLAALLAGTDLAHRLRVANATAAEACLRRGAQASMPSRAAVEARLGGSLEGMA